MENYLRIFDTEADYESVKDGLVYPTVSYTVDTDKLWYIKRVPPIQNLIIATYSVTEDQVGQDVLLASNCGNCSDIILDGESLSTPISINSVIVTPTSYGVYSSMTFTDDSWVVSPSKPWEITFDKPLQEGDMIGLSLFIPGYNVMQNNFAPYEEVISQGILTPIGPNDTKKFTCNYTTALTGIDFNILVCAFTSIDEDGTVTEDNFIGATYEIKSGGSPSSVIVKPAEATTYIVKYILSKETAINAVVKNISKNATSVDLSSCDTSNVTDMSEMFRDCTSLTSITFGDNFNTSNVTDMSGMFRECNSLTSLNLSIFDTSNVTSMKLMFSGCNSLSSLEIASFETSNVADMGSMFGSCSGLTSLDLSNFNTSNVTNMSYMFTNCYGLTSLDVSSFDTSKVINMRSMFGNCGSLTSLNISSFNTSNVTNMSYMFTRCSGLTSLDLSVFNTNNVTSMEYMFQTCSGLTSLDLSSFDTSNVVNMSYMFTYCSGLTSITMKNNVSAITNVTSMFNGITTTGTFYYNGDYDYSKIIAVLPSTWTAVDLNGVGGGAPA